MLARTSLSKESSTKSAAQPAPKTLKAESVPEEQLEAPSLRKLAWNFGDIQLSAPAENDPPPPVVNGRAVTSILGGARSLPWPMQAKLEVGAVDDPLEREAHHVAEQVMRMPDPPQSNPTTSQKTLERHPEYPTLSDMDSRVRRKCSCGGSCDKCKAEQTDEEHGTVQRKPVTPHISTVGSSSPATGVTAPPIVHEVLRSPGQPLDAETRAFFEPRFGRDFSRVRVHTDATSMQSARHLNANAYTAASSIVFGAGRFLPGRPEGRRLLAHELTHVVQQRSTLPFVCSLADPLDIVGREAGGIEDTFVRGGETTDVVDFGSEPGKSFLQRDPPRVGTPPDPPDYDRTVFGPTNVPKGLTAEQARAALDQQKRAGEITDYAVNGVTRGEPAEVFLLNLIYALGKQTRWGIEAHLVTAIGWPGTPKPSDPAPQGQVIVRINRTGAATAELIARGPLPSGPPTTFKDGSDKLTHDFGFATVQGWSGADPKKDAAEIRDVLAALSLVQSRAPKDILALKGVDLIRVASLPQTEGAEFFANDNTPGNNPWLKLSDKVFSADSAQFFGGAGSPVVPSSFQAISHEVGHAVETQELRAAKQGVYQTSAETAAAQKRLAGEAQAFDKEKHKTPKFYREFEKTHEANVAAGQVALAHQTQAAAGLRSAKISASAITTFERDAQAKGSSAASSLASAKGTLQGQQPNEIQEYVHAIEDAAAAITKFGIDAKAGGQDIAALESVVRGKIQVRRTAGDVLVKAAGAKSAVEPFRRAAAAQDAWFEAERILARARGWSARLQKFVELINANHIRRFTQYAADTWNEAKPEEFYAEAYSLWLTDPKFLETNYEKVFEFFQKGDYRN